MALSATCIAEVRNGGSDTANAGIFNPGATLTGNLAATNANTSSPVVTSATYNFVAGDVGSWLFVKSGTNWTPGWYKIVSVAANAATLDASVGAAFLYSTASAGPYAPNTVAGCATVASPTSGSWTVDYSQQDSPQFSLTGLTTSAANAIILTASASVNMIGNGIVITGGTNFTTGVYQINSVSAGVSITVDRNCTTAAGAAGTAAIGGGLASPGMAGSLLNANTRARIFVKYNATAYTITSASTNIAAGCINVASNQQVWISYDTNRHMYNSDANRSTLKLGSVSTATIFSGAGGALSTIANFILDGNSQTTSIGVNYPALVINCKAQNFTGGAFTASNAATVFIRCSATANSTAAFSSGTQLGIAIGCEAYSNTCPGFSALFHCMNCLSYNNSGATTDGFLSCLYLTNCTSYGSGRDNYRNANNGLYIIWTNCISEAATAIDFNQAATIGVSLQLTNCASYSVSGTGRTSGSAIYDSGAITGSGSFFVAAGSANFALNNTAGAGALCRGTGFPATFPAGTTANYLDVGAAQHQDSAAGSSPNRGTLTGGRM